MEIRYFLLDPTGNRTLLMERPEAGSSLRASVWKLAAGELERCLPAVEQTGFFDFHETDGALPSLSMAGGEFCGNATLSAGALYGLLKGLELPYGLKLSVSGAPDPVEVQLQSREGDVFTGRVTMPPVRRIGRETLRLAGRELTLPAVHFDGITHLIWEGTGSRPEAEAALKARCREMNCAAMGLLFYNRAEGSLTPLVYVPAADTLFWESSCASGTAALGAYMAEERGEPVTLTLREPAGCLKVEAAPGETPRLTGSVRLLQQGTLTL